MTRHLTESEIDRAAEMFAEARRSRTQVEELPSVLEPHTVAEAYAIQSRLVEKLGWRIGGWFCGCTNPDIQAQLGLAEPYCAPLFSHLIHKSPAVLDSADFSPIVLECEFAFVLKYDLPARGNDGYLLKEVEAAIETVHPAIEVVAGTLKNWQQQSPHLIIADNGVDGALVYGTGLRRWRAHDLAHIQVQLFVDGAPVQTGSGANVLGNPLKALQWLANEQSRRGNDMIAGHVYNTGTATPMQSMRAGQRAIAAFGPLGQSEVRLI